MNTKIDFATADDLESMADLLAELFTLESDFKPERAKQIAGLRLIFDNPTVGQLFVLRVDGQIAGMANALYTVSTAEGGRVVLLEDVIVKAALRGRKLGRRLIEHILAWAGASAVVLPARSSTIPPSRLPADDRWTSSVSGKPVRRPPR